MLEASAEAVKLGHGKSREDLAADRTLQLALARLIEIVGEAASRIPGEDRQRFPVIPWADIIGMRNRLVHAYMDTDLDVLLGTIEEDLPALIPHLEAALRG